MLFSTPRDDLYEEDFTSANHVLFVCYIMYIYVTAMSTATALPPGPSGMLPNTVPTEVTALLIDTRTLRPFKSSEEYLYAMREDLAEWLHALYPELGITVDLFMDRLEDGIALCKVRVTLTFRHLGGRYTSPLTEKLTLWDTPATFHF